MKYMPFTRGHPNGDFCLGGEIGFSVRTTVDESVLESALFSTCTREAATALASTGR